MKKAKKNLILIGGGGHCKACIEVIESTGDFAILGILDLPEKLGNTILNYQIIGNDSDIEKHISEGCWFFISIGHIKEARLRKNIFEKLNTANAQIATVISPSAKVSGYAQIGTGSIVMDAAHIGPEVKIGDNCILNTACNIEHESTIGHHCHISTHAVINGTCTIDNEVFIGSNATLKQQIHIPSNTLIGAGAMVTKSILQPGIYIGNPAKLIEK